MVSHQTDDPLDRLESRAEIAAYLKINERTVSRWMEAGLPVHFRLYRKQARLYAHKSELDSWLKSRDRKPENGSRPEPLPTAASVAVAAVAVPLPESVSPPQSAPETTRKPRWALVAAGVTTAILGGWAFWPRSSTRAANIDSKTSYSLTRNPSAVEVAPDLSPDGTRLAYVRSGPEGKGLFVRQLRDGEPHQLTDTPDGSPKWSPDGRQIAFSRWTPAEYKEILVISAEGGKARPVGKAMGWTLDWTPDGKAIVGLDRESTGASIALFTIDIETGRRQWVTAPPPGTNDSQPAFSPDGKTLAFVRYRQEGDGDLQVMPAAGGQPKAITSDCARIHSFTWTPDGRHLVLSSNRAGSRFKLWKVAATGLGKATLVKGVEENAVQPAMAKRPSQADRWLVYSKLTDDTDIWDANLESSGISTPHPILASNWAEKKPAYSPDGRTMAFVSDASGHPEIWLAGAQGTNPLQLTALKSVYADSPCWSPDGERIAFTAQVGGLRRIYIVDRNGAHTQRLTADETQEREPAWSRNGRFVYFGSERSGSPQIRRIEPGKPGTGIQVTAAGGWEARESPDGSRLYFVRNPDAPGLYSMPAGGGAEELISAVIERNYWAVSEAGIFFVDMHHTNEVDSGEPLRLYRFDTRKIVDFGTVPQPIPGFSFHPDGKTLLWARRGQHLSDLILTHLGE